jgi:hypothetical protein
MVLILYYLANNDTGKSVCVCLVQTQPLQAQPDSTYQHNVHFFQEFSAGIG